ncbi:helix-turn-helix domain-containing protein [Brachybacterium saurashtrense]|uniref:XRE family transcriptional regulator n=1 Tax=Brachybacterium saurashtrense TaxID=556288 RepID=A0A345YSN3_9MICO|nr:helix-turn-helix transcriptional regulator [Brachybacterium saurashtrense]AXK46935.1 XRE family transcriptional regulator [Brachybacterium saurashtrense]RRR22650.1 XRE family transcriptional regulator [Brachybacterium saurashtrense]
MASQDDERFATALRAAIAQSGLSLTAISQRLRARHRPISVATLSNWQSGKSLPGGEQSFGVLAALEELLGHAPDSLAGLVGAPRLRGRAAPTESFVGNRSSKEVFAEALTALGFSSPRQYAHERVHHQLVVVDHRIDVQRFDYRPTVRALESGTCRLPVVYVLGPDEPNVEPRYTALEGCSLGRRVSWPDRRAYGVEVLVDGTLDAGQVAAVAYRVELTARAEDLTAAMYSLPRRANDVLLEVEFRGGRRPVECERYRRTKDGESITPVRLDHRDRLQLSDARFGPGTFGLRWSWEDCDGEGEDDGAEEVLGRDVASAGAGHGE